MIEMFTIIGFCFVVVVMVATMVFLSIYTVDKMHDYIPAVRIGISSWITSKKGTTVNEIIMKNGDRWRKVMSGESNRIL